MGLRLYKAKRNFSATREPSGRVKKVSRARTARFVVQEHAARRLHFDFRLEMDGVLKSWAVPKGIPMTRGDRRLAVQVEDHPLEYGGFEGVIPAGQYGAGTVMLWDRGTYELRDATKGAVALEAGHLSFVLHGKKLDGHWSLIRMRHGDSDGKSSWLLIKTEETLRPISARARDASVKSGRGLEQIGRSPGSRRWTRDD